MAEPIKVKGLVIRQVNYGDYDKMLTLLTAELGKISVSAKGVRSMKSKNRAASELLCFGEFILNPPKNEVYSLSSAECIESFYKLRDDYLRLALGIYMADLAGHLSPEDMEMGLKVLLNCLYMLQDGEKDIHLLKIIYDLRILKESGFLPRTASCVSCDSEEGPFSFSAISGGVLCRKCASLLGLKPEKGRAIEFMDYIINSPFTGALFKSVVDTETLESATRYTESFISCHVAEQMKTLDYFKKLVKMQ